MMALGAATIAGLGTERTAGHGRRLNAAGWMLKKSTHLSGAVEVAVVVVLAGAAVAAVA